MLDSKALTKIQSIILIAVIIIAAVGGVAVYVLDGGEEQSSDTIKIGILDDLDGLGKEAYQSVILAAEQINAEGGLLGRRVEVFGEDNDGGGDPVLINIALTRLIFQHEVDFITGPGSPEIQEIVAEHKRIFIAASGSDELSRKVLENYERYKYYFTATWNSSAIFLSMIDSIFAIRENLGFNKIGIISEDTGWNKPVVEGLASVLPQNGFELEYQKLFPLETIDFSSYFAAAEAAGVELLLPLIFSECGIPFVKEYYDRQSPMFIYGGLISMASLQESWEWTDGKCEDICIGTLPVAAGYPLTSKTLPTREAYIERWNETPFNALSYDIIRFILADAIERAGTIETEAVIKALEETSIETSNAKNVAFTTSHDVLVGENINDPEEDYMFAIVFQWQDGDLIPVYPKKIMEEAGAIYTFPDWLGPWDNIS